MANYFRLTSRQQTETVVNKSRFIATAIPLRDLDSLYQLQTDLRADHGRANHHCLAYVLGDPAKPLSAGSSDDGEPSGTAGKPMLNILLQRQVGEIGVVVTRYFGGVKLGAGGLIRAYAGAVSALLDEAELEEVEPQRLVYLSYPYSLESKLAGVFSAAEVQVIEQEFTTEVRKQLSLPASLAGDFERSLTSLEYLGVVHRWGDE